MSLLEQLKAGKSVVKTVILGNVDLGLRLLSDNDYLEAGLAVIDFFKAKGMLDVNVASSELFEAEKANQLLLRGLVTPGGDPVADSPLQLRNALSRADKDFLMTEYLDFERQHSPMAGRNMNDAEFEALLDTLKKTPETANLSDLNTDTLKRLITALVSQPAS